MLMFLKKMKKSKAGYTLTELIVVVTVLGILAAVATPFVGDYVKSARVNADLANARVMEDVIKRQVANGETKPTDAASAETLIKKELNPLPTPQTDGEKFIFVKDTLAIKVAKPANGDIIIED